MDSAAAEQDTTVSWCHRFPTCTGLFLVNSKFCLRYLENHATCLAYGTYTRSPVAFPRLRRPKTHEATWDDQEDTIVKHRSG